MSRLFAIEDALDSDAWYTPEWIFDGLGIAFDLDVAAPSDPLPWVIAAKSYTVADDGLSQPWYGTVWCNPPYSDPSAWCRRWAEHSSGCILIRADISTSGPFAAVTAATSMYTPAKRLQFVNGHGDRTGAVNFSSVLLGRGATCNAALQRLAAKYGGTARLLCPIAPRGSLTGQKP